GRRGRHGRRDGGARTSRTRLFVYVEERRGLAHIRGSGLARGRRGPPGGAEKRGNLGRGITHSALCADRVLAVPPLYLACHSLPAPGHIGIREITLQANSFRLKSGLRLIVEEDHSSPVVGVVAVVGVGSSSDPQGKEGLAHFVEHLSFRSRPDAKSSIS